MLFPVSHIHTDSQSLKRGFTLVELMVTVGIFVFMTALILWRYGSFNSGTLLTNIAYDVALSIRQAQTYGLSVRATDSGTNPSSSFGSAYGIHFDRAGNPTQFIFFADGNSTNPPNWNGILDCSGSTCSVDQVLGTYNLKQGATISDLCVGNGFSCFGNDNVNYIDITFRRPDPTAYIFADNNPGIQYSYAEITVQSADRTTKHVISVNQMGQIQVK